MTHLGPSLRRRRTRAWTGWRLLVGLVLSLAFNLALLSLAHIDWKAIHAFRNEVRPVSMTPLSPEAWAANRAVTGQAPPPAERRPRAADPPRPAAPPSPDRAPEAAQALANRQVVDVAPGNEKVPNASRLLAETSNTVEKETVSRFARPGQERTLPRPTQNLTPTPPQQPSGERVARRDPASGGTAAKPGSPGAAPRPEPGRRDPDRLALNLDPEGLRRARPPTEAGAPDPTAPRSPGQEGEGGEGAREAPGRPGGQPILQPSAAFYDKLSGGAFPDHVEGVDVGDATFLNTREWKYAGYFNRIKQSVAEHWDPGSAIRVRDPRGERFLYKDRTTVLAIVLTREGGVKDVRVARTSGVDFLDQTAVDAFEKAQPFLNPPSGLADAQGEIRFSFGFHLEAAGSGFRFFQAPGR
jgi:TonB family protein